jgi:hypothetical protein
VLLLMTAAHPTVMEWRHPHLGRLAVPVDCEHMAETAAAGVPWAGDNGAFGGFDASAFERMLGKVAGVARCLFVAAPDVVEQTEGGPVGDAAATLERFDEWEPRIRDAGLPVALVAQDGLAPADVPWRRVDALFVGGSDAFKLGPGAEAVVVEARRRGRWAHMGRVNSARRVRYAAAIGCQSFDGSQFSVFRSTWLPRGLRWAEAASQGHQGRLAV